MRSARCTRRPTPRPASASSGPRTARRPHRCRRAVGRGAGRVPRAGRARRRTTPSTPARSATSRRRPCRCRSPARCSSQWIHQGVDVWHAGPIGAFVEEEVTALAPRPGRLRTADGWGVLTCGGVMANIMAMTVARDVWLPKLRGIGRPAARRRARGRPRLRERPDPFLDRAGARRARVPRRHARGDRQRRAVPAAGRAGGRSDRATTGPRA